MKEALLGIALGLGIIAAVYPYYCLTDLPHIADEIEKIRKILEKREWKD